MSGAPNELLMERVSLAIESAPATTKTGITRLVKPGTKQAILRATDALISLGCVVTTPGERAPVLTSVRPYRTGEPVSSNGEADSGEETSETIPESTEKPSEKPVRSTNGKPSANQGGPRQTASAGSGKSGQVRPATNQAANGGAMLFTEARCRICRNPPVRARVNDLLASGFTIAGVVDLLTPTNEGLPARSRITENCVAVHRKRHFSLQVPAAEVCLKIQEQYADEQATLGRGVVNILTPAAYFTTVMVKAAQAMQAEGSEVGVGDGIVASRELSKLLAHGDDMARWADAHAKMNKILACMREVVPEQYHEQILARVEGRPWPPTSGGPLKVIEGGLATDDDFGLGEGEDDLEDYDDEDN